MEYATKLVTIILRILTFDVKSSVVLEEANFGGGGRGGRPVWVSKAVVVLSAITLQLLQLL